MIKIANSFFLVLCGFCIGSACHAETEKWQLVKEEAGIKIYKYNSADAEIVKAKGTVRIKSPISAVEKIINDIEYRHKWIPYLERSQLIQRKSEVESVEYSLFSAPWPVSDRDFLYSLERIEDQAMSKVYRMKSVSSQRMPEIKSAIRAELYESVYTITEIEDGNTQVELSFHADLKGWIPNWISNVIQRAVPYKTLFNLRNELNKRNNP